MHDKTVPPIRTGREGGGREGGGREGERERERDRERERGEMFSTPTSSVHRSQAKWFIRDAKYVCFVLKHKTSCSLMNNMMYVPFATDVLQTCTLKITIIVCTWFVEIHNKPNIEVKQCFLTHTTMIYRV